MGKILKYKQIIVVLCLVTFLFIPLQKPKETKAIAIEVTTGLILLCAALAVGTGYVLTDQNQMEDVGSKVWEGIKDSHSNAFTVDGDRIKVNTSVNLFNDIINIVKTLPVEDIIINKLLKTGKYDKIYNISLTPSYFPETSGMASSVITLSTLHNDGLEGLYYFKFDGQYKYFTIQADSNFDVIFDVSTKNTVYGSVNGEDFEIKAYKNYDTINESLKNISYGFSTNNYTYRVDSVYGYESVLIPYAEENKKSVSADIPKTYFPTYGGSISAPINKPITDYVPSVSAPLDKLEDFTVGGDVVIDSDSVDIPDTGVDEGTGEDTGILEGIKGFFTGLWDMLKELLASIVGLLTGILDLLKNLIIPDTFNNFDFSPLYLSVSDKFPFCIPFDLVNMINEFKADKKEPKFIVDMSGFSSSKTKANNLNFEIDLTKFEQLFVIVRTLTLVTFIFGIAYKTRDIIKG